MQNSAVRQLDYWFGKNFCAIELLSEGRSSSAAPTGATGNDRLSRLWHQPCPLTGGKTDGHFSHTDYPKIEKDPKELVARSSGLIQALGNERRAKARLSLQQDSIFPQKFKITVARSDTSVRAVLSCLLARKG